MKIEKKNPKHLRFLVKAVIVCSLAVLLKPRSSSNRKRVVLYGHQLNGNIKAFADYCSSNNQDIELYFLADPWLYKKMIENKSSVKPLNMTSFSDMRVVAGSDAIITTHGLHIFHSIFKRTGIKFIDVWHGVPYKGWDSGNFKEQNSYDEVWVSSPTMMELYEKMYRFPKEILHTTGYARIDSLVRGDYDKKEILKKYEIEGFNKYILIAPTWKQDDQGRSIFPYGVNAGVFFSMLQKIGEENSALVVFRAHLNSGDSVKESKFKNVKVMPYTKYPVTEEFLWIADILVSDWSSIVFDYLPLNRPTIFLDVPSPFKNGFTLGPEYRFGFVALDMSELAAALSRYTTSPNQYQKENGTKVKKSMDVAYGETADGYAAKRYYDRLMQII